MNFLFRAVCSSPQTTRPVAFLLTLLTPCIDWLRFWWRGRSTPRHLHYHEQYSRFQPVGISIRANPRRHKPSSSW